MTVSTPTGILGEHLSAGMCSQRLFSSHLCSFPWPPTCRVPVSSAQLQPCRRILTFLLWAQLCSLGIWGLPCTSGPHLQAGKCSLSITTCSSCPVPFGDNEGWGCGSDSQFFPISSLEMSYFPGDWNFTCLSGRLSFPPFVSAHGLCFSSSVCFRCGYCRVWPGTGETWCRRIINCDSHLYLTCLQEQVPFAGGGGAAFMDSFVTAAVTILCPQGEKELTLLVELLVKSLCQV